jgi:outer membrane protein TolC
VVLIALALQAGCTRPLYRNWADRQSYSIIAERIVYPTFDIGRTKLEPPPVSRISDPFNPDFPPKPPDDPAAAIFMANPGGMKGAKHWDRDGVTDIIEPPGWDSILDRKADGTVRLDQDKAVEVALLNSREYQFALEDVYISALALTLNRFEFQCQWFLTNDSTYTHFGSGGSPNGETNTVDMETHFGFTRNFAAGGQLLTDFANSLVYEFTGAGSRRFNSNFLISLVQPVLRGAGRKFRLETLTQGERNVLYSVRSFARFRKQFWTTVAIENGSAGYLDLLLQLQTIRNNEANLKRQEETYRLYYQLFLGGRASRVELDQFFQSLQTAKLAVIQAQTQFNTSLDLFKFTLGLPPLLPVEIDDSLLNTFILVEPELEKLRDDLEVFQRERLAELGEPPSVDTLQAHYQRLLEFADRAPKALSESQADLDLWAQRLARPVQPEKDPEVHDRAKSTYDTLVPQAAGVVDDIKANRATIEEHRAAIKEETRQESWEALVRDVKSVLATADTIIAIQTQAKIHLIELTDVNLPADVALMQAKESRLDLMNQLGAVTDSWRKVTVAANALKADLNLVASANFGTDPDHLDPFNFAAEASTYQVGLQFAGPLNRLAQRNAYRLSIINYQRARRGYMALSDTIELQIRRDLRNLNQLSVGFEISRQQLLSAARQYENARIILLGPREGRSANDTTTLNLLQALDKLVGARNGLAQNYINYEQQRVQLLLDLEALQLDPQGFPIRESLSLGTGDGAPAAHPAAPEEIGTPQPGPAGTGDRDAGRGAAGNRDGAAAGPDAGGNRPPEALPAP